MNTTADRMAAAYFDAIEFLCRVTPKGWYAERGTARAAVTRADIATLNVACDTSLEPDLGSLGELATEVGRQAAYWSIMVRAGVGDEVAGLAARHGLVQRSDLPFLACAGGDFVFRAGTAPRDLVRRVGAAESDRYTAVLAQGFEVPDGAFGSLMGGGVLDSEPVTGYLAEESGRPAATGLGIRTRDVVGVFNIAVVPSARCRGLGRAVTEAVLLDGVASGADAAYLHASAMGRPLYESMGFRLVENWTVFTAG
ncbi:GNAT family N-acetyltransferase [Plantactinospora sp. KLBMP9567]|uniref:GNAT family N-acetyltransferase n=1 Tax=Plantactinospora sp. KLBMP9567 TaxID=3085900 RepID=UPI002980D999|nr:GNAT family N-acetyltransferase [Plantactinospora sp. KLBMP9567]MDW5324361.1 GNAT family N-acetyltransferase [Plantactinospora sp. KLBMP9567]